MLSWLRRRRAGRAVATASAPAGRPLPLVLSCRGPVGQLVLTDVAWQDRPRWRDDDHWTATWAPSLSPWVPDADVWPGLAVWVDVPAGEEVRWTLTRGPVPPSASLKVRDAVLTTGDQGVLAEIDLREDQDGTDDRYVCADVALPAGEHSVEVWVDHESRERVREVVLLVRSSRPRRSLAELRG